MRSLEEIYVHKTIQVLADNLNTQISSVWNEANRLRNRILKEELDDSPSIPALSDNSFLPWSVEKIGSSAGVWSIVVNCDLRVLESIESLHTLGNFALTIGIVYSDEYKINKYAAISRMRLAIRETIRKHREEILYNGGELEEKTLSMMEINDQRGNRDVVNQIIYDLTAAS